jgi:hypothetical protein
MGRTAGYTDGHREGFRKGAGMVLARFVDNFAPVREIMRSLPEDVLSIIHGAEREVRDLPEFANVSAAPRITLIRKDFPSGTVKIGKATAQGTTEQSVKDLADDLARAEITGPEKRILDAIAWMAPLGVEQPTSALVAFLAEYSPTSSSFTNPRGALRTKGLIDFPSKGTLMLTPAGARLAQRPESASSNRELHDRVLARLPGPERKLLAAVLTAFPLDITSERLAEITNYSVTSSSFTNPRGHLRSLGFIDFPRKGVISASAMLFPLDR